MVFSRPAEGGASKVALPVYRFRDYADVLPRAQTAVETIELDVYQTDNELEPGTESMATR